MPINRCYCLSMRALMHWETCVVIRLDIEDNSYVTMSYFKVDARRQRTKQTMANTTHTANKQADGPVKRIARSQEKADDYRLECGITLTSGRQQLEPAAKATTETLENCC